MGNHSHYTLDQKFGEHAIAQWPNEAAAVVIAGCTIPVKNTASDPRRFVQFDPTELMALELANGPITAYIHSHTSDGTPPLDPRYRYEWPSHLDIQAFIDVGKPFGIAHCTQTWCGPTLWLNDNNRAPLLDRTFIHGVNDCYSLIRDYYLSAHNIDLPNFARGWPWWENGENLYLDGFEAAGFFEVPRHEAKEGDALIYKVGATVPNHAAAIVGPDAILHHLIDRKSRVETRRKWSKLEYIAVRHKSRA